MLEVIVGFIMLITPYLLGCILNILVYGFDFEHWEGIGVTYASGMFILVILCSVVSVSYFIGHYVLSIIN